MITPAARPTAPAPPEDLLGQLGALADPTRLRLLHLLERQELGVAELCEVLRLPQSTVSRHLKTLSGPGWVASRREGTANLYRLAEGPGPSARRLWRVARAESQAWPALSQDRLRLERRLKARRDEAQRFFAGAAAEWDRLRAELYGRAFGEAALLALLPPGWTVADLGCGTGALAAALSPWVGRVVGVDQSPAMLRAAGRRTAGLGNVELRRGRLEALPLRDGECDAALLVLALTYLAEPRSALAEAARAVRPGGRLAVVDLLAHGDESFRRRLGQASLGFEPARLEALLAEAGWASPAVRSLPPDPGARGPALLVARAQRPG
ncbi:MAG TPA: metalloregulator ArsR/SmtB family transcription factor [Anaeromyxobacteraceae bacterium]|nr:metalloregulator ArsR/SmtB family transcription factor [Anaeromyxobacteraceae bacterium]